MGLLVSERNNLEREFFTLTDEECNQCHLESSVNLLMERCIEYGLEAQIDFFPNITR